MKNYCIVSLHRAHAAAFLSRSYGVGEVGDVGEVGGISALIVVGGKRRYMRKSIPKRFIAMLFILKFLFLFLLNFCYRGRHVKPN